MRRVLNLNNSRQAIQTKCLLPTNTKGKRIKVSAYAGSKIYPWDYALDVEENHAAAALKYSEEMGWDQDYLIGGDCTNDAGFVFVAMIERDVD